MCLIFREAHTLSNVRNVSLRSSTSSSVKSLIASASDTAMLLFLCEGWMYACRCFLECFPKKRWCALVCRCESQHPPAGGRGADSRFAGGYDRYTQIYLPEDKITITESLSPQRTTQQRWTQHISTKHAHTGIRVSRDAQARPRGGYLPNPYNSVGRFFLPARDEKADLLPPWVNARS